MNVTDCFHFGYNMDKLDAMNAFVKVVASGSYAEAARKLGLTRSAVSKAVMELEQLLGARLLDRTTRPASVGLRRRVASSRSTRRCRSARSISARRSRNS
jgi:DNA-binding transcriptional LysR family regulator